MEPFYAVALRKESVDRNDLGLGFGGGQIVALRKESVDRNSTASETGAATIVALRKESVDRNVNGVLLNVHDLQSLSARRAWIEI